MSNVLFSLESYFVKYLTTFRFLYCIATVSRKQKFLIDVDHKYSNTYDMSENITLVYCSNYILLKIKIF